MIKNIFFLMVLWMISIPAVWACYLRPIPQKLLSGTVITWSIGWTTTTGRNVLCSLIVKTPPVYTNTEYGFQLTLPKSWKKYKSVVYDATGNIYNSGYVAKVNIVLPTHSQRPGIDDPSDRRRMMMGYTGNMKQIKWYADMLYIKTFTYAWYEQAINTEDAIRTKETWAESTLGKNNKYVFVCDWPNDRPDDVRNIYSEMFDTNPFFHILNSK